MINILKNKKLLPLTPHIFFAIINFSVLDLNYFNQYVQKDGLMVTILSEIVLYVIANLLCFPLAFTLSKEIEGQIEQKTYSNRDQVIANSLVQKFIKNNKDFSFKNMNQYYYNNKNIVSYLKKENIYFHHNVLIYDHMNKIFYVTLVKFSKNGVQFKENYFDSLKPMYRDHHTEPDDLLFCLEWLFTYDQQFKIDNYYECKDKIEFIRNNYEYLTNKQDENNENIKLLKKKIIQFKNDLNNVYQKYIHSMSDLEHNAYYNIIESYESHLESSKIKEQLIESSKIKEQLIKASIIESKN